MLDKLKDIVPIVDEEKANLIYQKSRKPKFSFNYKLVLRFAVLLIILLPVVMIVGLNEDKIQNGLNNDASIHPESNLPNGDKIEYFYSDYKDNALKIYFYDDYDIYYIKEYPGYRIVSVSVDGKEIEAVDSVYCVNSLVEVIVVFNENDISDRVLFSVSIDNRKFEGYCEYVK